MLGPGRRWMRSWLGPLIGQELQASEAKGPGRGGPSPDRTPLGQITVGSRVAASSRQRGGTRPQEGWRRMCLVVSGRSSRRPLGRPRDPGWLQESHSSAYARSRGKPRAGDTQQWATRAGLWRQDENPRPTRTSPPQHAPPGGDAGACALPMKRRAVRRDPVAVRVGRCVSAWLAHHLARAARDQPGQLGRGSGACRPVWTRSAEVRRSCSVCEGSRSIWCAACSGV